MKKEIIVLSDIELGAGNLTDDFISDKTLAKFIKSLKGRNHPVDLILNGDIIDFLKCPYIQNEKYSYPRHVSEEISLVKLQTVYDAHSLVFDALKEFGRPDKNKIYFVIGNHDHDLYFKGVQKAIKRLINKKKGVYFPLRYKQHSVWVEHGHQHDFLNKTNHKKPFDWYLGKKILNYPWVSFGVISRALIMKEEHPFMERIKPYPLLFKHHKVVIRKISRGALEYALKSFLYYPLRFFRDPTYRMPRDFVMEFYTRFRNGNWDIEDITDNFKRKKKNKMRDYRLYVFGHTHEKLIEEKDGWAIAIPDTWRDEYTMDPMTKELIPKTKKYVQVFVSNDDQIAWEMQEIKVKRKPLFFNDVIKEEIKYIKLVAKDEGFVSRVLK
ncbi:hypothetical protein HOD05_03115 [Candidatus Woesearchaeota archaeon]|jgi:UDP-2,3-diacylglucosamine pyrophosphatase LpxH|nr:hypothetical protein [Candidatus Woesearchaeota archaeon]MBT4151364.1 hypothetical protein [Candidatus Woesearchaeota archaeon]MBT4247762.1 hypothetical protein [Candidatus Woesearchaeota archaeon]MBT4434186.1 hypothetical protein [Candidatus Woesearchaeota archaeon]MBT7332344.1 hypothetical protein [Candidatus Woesearchaeota archaeon]